MADTVKKTKATATPKQASAKNVKVAEVAKPTTTHRNGLELVAKVEMPKKAKSPAAKPSKSATKKENVVSISQWTSATIARIMAALRRVPGETVMASKLISNL